VARENACMNSPQLSSQGTLVGLFIVGDQGLDYNVCFTLVQPIHYNSAQPQSYYRLSQAVTTPGAR
jgi:hypothetical protein